MKSFMKFLSEQDAPPGMGMDAPPDMGGMPMGGGPPMGAPPIGGPPPMGGPMGGPPGMDPMGGMGAPAPPQTIHLEPKNVWSVWENLLSKEDDKGEKKPEKKEEKPKGLLSI